MDGFPVRTDGRRPLRYRLVSGTLKVGLAAFLGDHLRVEGMDNLPGRGPIIIASNHLSNLDPCLIGALVPGAIFAMAKGEMFGQRLWSWWLLGCNVFPVERQAADRGALMTALSLLQERSRLLLFVEGTRAPRPGMQRAEPGVGLLQRRTGAQVVPLGVFGTERAWPRASARLYRAPVTLRFGEPFLPADVARGRGGDQQRADEIGRRIAALLPPRYRGVYSVAE